MPINGWFVRGLAQARTRCTQLVAIAAALVLVPQPSVAQPWPARESLRIGGVSDPAGTIFGSISKVTADSTGRIYVLDAHSYDVRVFSAAGRLGRTMGRRGRGPGELEGPYAMGFVRGGLWVSDDALRRVVFFGPSGTPDSTVRVEYVPPTGLGADAPIALATDGSMVITPTIPGQRTIDREPVPLPILRVYPSGRVDTLHVLQLRGIATSVDLGGRQGLVRQPLPFRPESDIATDGSLFAVVEQDGAATASPPTFRLIVKDGQGRPLGQRAVRYTPVPVPAAWRDSVLQQYRRLGRGDSPAAQQRARRITDALEFPATFPPVERVLVGGDRTVWVLIARSGDVAQWLVFDDRAVLLGSVQLPAEMNVRYATRRSILANGLSAEGEPIVVRYDVAAAARR